MFATTIKRTIVGGMLAFGLIGVNAPMHGDATLAAPARISLQQHAASLNSHMQIQNRHAATVNSRARLVSRAAATPNGHPAGSRLMQGRTVATLKAPTPNSRRLLLGRGMAPNRGRLLNGYALLQGRVAVAYRGHLANGRLLQRRSRVANGARLLNRHCPSPSRGSALQH